jgi:hypothetical protein
MYSFMFYVSFRFVDARNDTHHHSYDDSNQSCYPKNDPDKRGSEMNDMHQRQGEKQGAEEQA